MIEAVGISRDWREPEEIKMKQCPECEGRGEFEGYIPTYGITKDGERIIISRDKITGKCSKCHGTGEIEDTSDEFDRADDNRD